MITVVVIPAEIEQPVQRMEIEGELSDYQHIVGGLIEAVDCGGADREAFYVNEEGLLMDLDYNQRATVYTMWRTSRQAYLVGDAVLVGPVDDEGNTTSVPTTVLRWFGL
ncbi:MAG: DUF3846 domain-containing protein [Ornithinimicrobium sp.]